ncbi:MAG: hypothetical protein A3I66_09825 [Burkholderiales bacterium RIFCSPLOWO2_02_FULL_57_36]|nr:MAG: hypothetical protein A3I66_09825 [Burkholderiales bacterium RIFCSPLOWO2_02_FULL_57_36]
MNKSTSPLRGIDLEYYERRAQLLRDEAIRNLFTAIAVSFVQTARRLRCISVRGIEGQSRC